MFFTIILLLCLKQADIYTIAGNDIYSYGINANALKKKHDDPLLIQLGHLTEGLLYISEADYPLDPVSLPAPLTNERLIKIAQQGEPTGTHVEREDFKDFFQYYTSENDDLVLARRFQNLETFMKQNLDDIFVYRIGDEPRIVVLVLGTTKDRKRLVGFRTISIET